MEKYNRTKSTVSFINYHFVFCPRYRRRIFLRTDVEELFKKLAYEVCGDLNIELIMIDCGEDHVYLSLIAPPTLSPSSIMARIKGVTSKELREEFSHLEHLQSIWTRSYFVSTEEKVASEVITQYVEEQKKRG